MFSARHLRGYKNKISFFQPSRNLQYMRDKDDICPDRKQGVGPDKVQILQWEFKGKRWLPPRGIKNDFVGLLSLNLEEE